VPAGVAVATVFLVLILMTAPFLPAGPSVARAQDTADPAVERRLDTLFAARRGRFIVEVEVPGAGPPYRKEQIRRAQTGVLAAVRDADHRIVRLFRHVPYLAVEADPATVARLRRVPAVRAIVPEPRATYDLAGSIPQIGINSLIPTGDGTVVVVMDSGIDTDHPFFADTEFVAEACFSGRGTCPDGADEAFGPGTGTPCDGDGCFHGTFVAGIVAGRKNGLRGGAPGTRLVSIRAGGSAGLDETDVMAGLEFVIDLVAAGENIVAINMSFGGGNFTGNCDEVAGDWAGARALIDMLRYYWGVVSIAASGNDGEEDAIGAPACFSSVIAVGAVDKDDQLTAYSNTSSQIDLLAPGGLGGDVPDARKIRSSMPGHGVCPHAGCYDHRSGTSFATPHVTAAWAILRGAYPNAPLDEIETALKVSGRDIDARLGRVRPRIDLGDAILYLDRPTVHMDPREGTYLTPFELQVWGRSAIPPPDWKIWLTRDGSEPAEDAPGSELICEGGACGFGGFPIFDQAGPIEIRATAFFSLRGGRRFAGDTTRIQLTLRDPLPGPVDVQASDGLHNDRVRVKWTPLADATGYEIFTSLTDGANLVPIGPVHDGLLTEPVFEHVSDSARGVPIYYAVRAIIDGLPTLFSAPDAGHIRDRGIAVNASDGTHADRVDLTWDPSSWGQPAFDVEYRLFRATTEDFRTAEEIFHAELRTEDNYPAGVAVIPAAAAYKDYDVAPGKVHYYWVIGMDSHGRSPLADPEKGHAKGP